MGKGMTKSVCIFIGALTGLPMIGQFDPQTIAGEIGKSSAQMVLAFVAVAEAVVIYRMFSMWRKDIESDQQKRDQERSKYEELLQAQVKTSTDLAISNQQLKESVYHFAETVKACRNK